MRCLIPELFGVRIECALIQKEEKDSEKDRC